MTPTNSRKESLPDAVVEENHIGTDEEGAKHYHCNVAGRVFVVTDGELLGSQEIDSLTRWVEHTDHVVGWESHRVDNRPLEDWLAEGLVA